MRLGTKSGISEALSSEKRKHPPIGLALGGGVARGWAHIGAIRALTEAGIKPDIIAGTSIGALVGAAYITGKLDTIEDWARSLNKRKMLSYMDIRWGGSGLMKGDRLAKVLKYYFGDLKIEDMDSKFAAVACDLRTGYEVWLQTGPLISALRASYALPGAFEPVKNRWSPHDRRGTSKPRPCIHLPRPWRAYCHRREP